MLWGTTVGLLSHKLSDCRHQTEISDRFFETSLGSSVTTAPFVAKCVESGQYDDRHVGKFRKSIETLHDEVTVIRFTVESEVCWCDEKGRAGLRSLLISAEERSVLQEWLAAKLEEDLPEAVASQFRHH